jgi:hypothetical protein
VAIYGAVSGFFNGAGANNQHPPGLAAGIVNAFLMTVFLGPVAIGGGALAGGCAGLVGMTVKIARKSKPPGGDT